MTILEFRERDDVAQLSVTTAEINVNREVLSFVTTAVVPKVIHVNESKSL